jgi:hypothetical protein
MSSGSEHRMKALFALRQVLDSNVVLTRVKSGARFDAVMRHRDKAAEVFADEMACYANAMGEEARKGG